MAELVDALGSGSSEHKLVGVRIPLSAPFFYKKREKLEWGCAQAFLHLEDLLFQQNHFTGFRFISIL